VARNTNRKAGLVHFAGKQQGKIKVFRGSITGVFPSPWKEEDEDENKGLGSPTAPSNFLG
jgi:hypothetical protein